MFTEILCMEFAEDDRKRACYGRRFMQGTNRIADMEPQERPYEKCMEHGAEYLTDAELLAVVIKTGAKGERSLDIARRILGLSKQYKGILGICHCSMEQLMQIRGVGKVKAVQLKCVAELARRFAKAQAVKGLSFKEPATIAEYYMEDFRHKEREMCMVLMLDSKCSLLREVHISTGTINASLVSPREIFREALQCNAVNLILLHNHPSGDSSPSNEDVAVTLRVKECGSILGIPLIDHIIIGDKQYASLRELGLLK